MINEIWHMDCASFLTLTFHMDSGKGAKMYLPKKKDWKEKNKMRLWEPGLERETYRVLGPQLHTLELFRQVSLSMCGTFWS